MYRTNSQVNLKLNKTDRLAMNDIFGPGSNVSGRVFEDYEALAEKVKSCKNIGQKVVLTSGTFDLLHIGHCRYFEKAREVTVDELGVDSNNIVLVVGVDGDQKVKKRKGPNRPITPQEERYEMLCHTRHVDLVMIKKVDDPKWHLIKVVEPDVLIISKRNESKYSKEKLAELNEYCGTVIQLEPQAETSTSAKIRLLHVNIAENFKDKYKQFRKVVIGQLDNFLGEIEEMVGNKKEDN